MAEKVKLPQTPSLRAPSILYSILGQCSPSILIPLPPRFLCSASFLYPHLTTLPEAHLNHAAVLDILH